jgi:hypothetical protein
VDLRDLVRALLAFDALTARQWVADAARTGLRWSDVPRPSLQVPDELSLAAGIVEMMAARSGQPPPTWAAAVPPSSRPRFLVRAAEAMPRLRRSCETEGPEALRRRRFFAPPEFLTTA